MSAKRVVFAAVGGLLTGIALQCLRVESWTASWWFLMVFFNLIWNWDRCDK